MSIFVPAPNCVVTTFLMELDGVLMSVMPSFRRRVGPINIFNLTSFNQTIDATFVTNVLTLLSSDVTYSLTQSRRQNVISDIAASTAANAEEVGEGGPALPSGCAIRLELVTGLPGRGAHGAVYVPGIPKSEVTLNTIDAGFISDLGAALATLIQDSYDDGWEMVIRSKFLANVPRASAVISPVTGVSYADAVVDYQRRRKPDAGVSDGDVPAEVFYLG